MVLSIQLGFSRSIGSVTSNEANKSVIWRAEWSQWTITARWNAASRTLFFRIHAIKTGHISESTKYRETGDVL